MFFDFWKGKNAAQSAERYVHGVNGVKERICQKWSIYRYLSMYNYCTRRVGRSGRTE